MQIRVDNRDVDFDNNIVPNEFSRSMFSSLCEETYILDYDQLSMNKDDLLWLIENDVDCIVLISGKSWDKLNGLKSYVNGLNVINNSTNVKFFDVIKGIFREADRGEVYKQLVSEKLSPYILHKWLLSAIPTDPIVTFLGEFVQDPESYYKILAVCLKPRLINPTYKLNVLNEKEKELCNRYGCTLWEARVY